MPGQENNSSGWRSKVANFRFFKNTRTIWHLYKVDLILPDKFFQMEIKGDTLLKKSNDLIEASLGESLALMSIESGKYFGMNQVAKYIWKEMDQEISFDDLISRLTELFDIDEETCSSDCRGFLGELYQKDMVSIR